MAEMKRIWEIDCLRVCAIFLMVIFHIVYDLGEFAGWDVTVHEGFWFFWGRISSALFIFVSGISSGLSQRGAVRNGLRLLLVAVGISGVTFLIFKEQYIQFGVLHFLGTAMLLYPLLQRLTVWLLGAMATVVLILASPLGRIKGGTSLLLPLGIKPRGFASVDYFPLVPYLAVYIIGIIAYKLFYYKRKSVFPFSWGNKYMTAISQRSLLIYIVHQPILLGVIFLGKWLAV